MNVTQTLVIMEEHVLMALTHSPVYVFQVMREHCVSKVRVYLTYNYLFNFFTYKFVDT